VIHIVPLLVGASIVLQGGLNRVLAGRIGLAPTVVVNAAVFAVACGAMWGLSAARPDWFPAGFAPSGERWQPKLWHVVPGLCGAVIVVGVPWAIGSLGATRVFITVVVAQVVGSALWDALVEGAAPSAMRLVGCGIAVAGVALASLR
jgi:Uncharacterized protein conserved in bacteria